MIVNTKNFKEACQTILFAIDTKDTSLFTETLELVADKKELSLNVTNREYYCSVKFILDKDEKFKAAVNAKTFLSLISKITTDTVDMVVSGNSLKIKANGDYTIPLIYNNDVMLELPTISMGTITNEMEINSSILQSILINNSKELQRGVISKPVQRCYYVDQLGSITFTSGACVNSFTLPKDIKILLNDKVVKLFKLFKSDNDVSFSMGQSAISDDMIQTTVKFMTEKVSLTAKLTDSSLITSVPVKPIRDMAQKSYPYTMVLNRNSLLQTLNRIMLFNDESKTYGNITAKGNQLTIKDFNGGSNEVITASGESQNINEYKMILDLKNLKLVLDGCEDEFVTMCFGDSKCVVMKKQSVCDIIPELKVN